MQLFSPVVLIILLTVLIFGGIIGFRAWSESQPGMYGQFASCLGEKGAKFYGAFWCPHCQDQKRMFGNSAKLLPYVECSLPDGRTMTAECKAKNIDGFPTWEFSDGSRLDGVVQISGLAEKTGCELPSPEASS